MNVHDELVGEGCDYIVKLRLLACDVPCGELWFDLYEPFKRIHRPEGRQLDGNRSCKVQALLQRSPVRMYGSSGVKQ